MRLEVWWRQLEVGGCRGLHRRWRRQSRGFQPQRSLNADRGDHTLSVICNSQPSLTGSPISSHTERVITRSFSYQSPHSCQELERIITRCLIPQFTSVDHITAALSPFSRPSITQSCTTSRDGRNYSLSLAVDPFETPRQSRFPHGP